MNEKMNLYYDEEEDFLEITTGDISNCYFDNIDSVSSKLSINLPGKLRDLQFIISKNAHIN